MKKLSAGVVLLVVLSISFALIPAVSAVDSDGDTIPDAKEEILKTDPNLWTNTDGIVYTEASVYPGLINPGETTTVNLRAIANITTEKGEMDVVLVTDLSGSMAGSRLDVAKDALKTFVGLAGDEMHIGLASFSNADQEYSNATWEKWLDQKNNGTSPFHPYAGCSSDKTVTSPENYGAYDSNAYSDAHIDMSFTQNKANLNSKIDSYAAEGGTNIAGGINAAKKMLEEQGNPEHLQVIVVMSDGIATMAPIEPDALDAYMPSDWVSDKSEIGRTAAKKASATVKDDGIIVYAIGFGDDADEATLMAVASTGNYYPADVTDIVEVYSEISGEIKKITGARAYHVIPDNVTYVGGSASAEPIVNGKTLEWIIGDLAPDAQWNVSFDVQPQNPGIQTVNAPGSSVTYIYGSPRNVPFQEVFVDVKTPPVADFRWTPEKPHTSKIVTFDASNSSDPDGGSIVSYEWSVSFEATGEIVTHVFEIEGNYTVTLTITDDDGESKEVSKVVKVVDNQLPVADFSWTPTGPHKRETVTFSASASYDPDYSDGHSIVSYQWSGSFEATGKIVTHVFKNGGNYTVTLTVTDDDGESKEVSKVVTIDDNLPPVAVAKARRNMTDEWQNENVTVPQYEPVMFDGSDSYDPDGYIVNYHWDWDLGDGKESPLAGPLHVYWENKTYNVSLIVEDNSGKRSEPVTLTVNVTPNNYIGSFANVSKNFTVKEDSDVNTTTGKPVSGIGNPVNIFVHTTADDVSVINYSVFVDGCLLATGNEQEMKNFSWISMSSGKHKIKVKVEEYKDYDLEWVIDVVNVWIKPVGD